MIKAYKAKSEDRICFTLLPIVLIFLFFTFLDGCQGSGQDPKNAPLDSTPPEVTFSDPANNDKGVVVNHVITVRFSEVMDASTFGPETFRVQNLSEAVVGNVTCNGNTVTFVPEETLAFATKFDVSLTAGIKDLNGDPMVQDYVWSFTTDVKPWAGEETVRTLYGNVKGYKDRSETWAWKNIPYARPPVDSLRWKAPREPEPWEETREETEFGNVCSQYILMESIIQGDEDCLYLNIWRPQSGERDLPVYFWIHGGGNGIGMGGFPDWTGAHLAQRSNLVVVTINYRLGPAGWFSHPALKSGETADALDDSGNYGTLDQIQALKFVRHNIRAFGGDPDNVTITGESAGGVDVLALLISPPAAGLFHQAMAQSGGIRTVSEETGEESVNDVILHLLVADGTAEDGQEADTILKGMTDAEVASYLRSKTMKDLLKCYEVRFGGMISFPNVFRDGMVIPLNGFDSLTDGAYPNKVPVIVGSNKEETKLFIFADPAFKGKDDLFQIVATYGTDEWKANGVDEVARRLKLHADQPNVYAYQFLWGAGGDVGRSVLPEPFGFKLGSFHTLEIPFFFDNDTILLALQLLIFTKENEPGRKALTDAMTAYAAAFARTGNPNGPGTFGLPTWEPWTTGKGEPKSILLDADNSGTLHIEMSPVELTEEGVKARMAEEVPEPLYSEAKAYLDW